MFTFLFFAVLQSGVPEFQPIQAEINVPVPHTDPDHTLWWIIGTLTTCVGTLVGGLILMYRSLMQSKSEEIARQVQEAERLRDMNAAKENIIKDLIAGVSNSLGAIKEKVDEGHRKRDDLDEKVRNMLLTLESKFQQIFNKLD